MPKFSTETPMVDRKFSGLDFKVPYVFAEGHALTKPEAAWLNSNLASVVGNAFSGDIRRGLAALNKAKLDEFVKGGGKAKDYKEITDPVALGWDFQKEFTAKFTDYELGESNRGQGGGAANDPLSQLIRMFSTVDVKQRLAAKGYKVAPLYKTPSNLKNEDGSAKYPSKWEELVQENILAKGEQFRAQAQAQLDSLTTTDGTTEGADDPLLAGITQEAAPASTEAPPAS